uniref:Uncharacterized protein n=1 Tax=virus sp. ctQ5V6 TaxID=2825815 RepID=A0A8S5RQH8_9VIRU|nr:MAG TPA: hypothetical protein [virus sp. ctQ5V6]
MGSTVVSERRFLFLRLFGGLSRRGFRIPSDPLPHASSGHCQQLFCCSIVFLSRFLELCVNLKHLTQLQSFCYNYSHNLRFTNSCE